MFFLGLLTTFCLWGRVIHLGYRTPLNQKVKKFSLKNDLLQKNSEMQKNINATLEFREKILWLVFFLFRTFWLFRRPQPFPSSSRFEMTKSDSGGQHSTVVEFALLEPQTQLPRVRILAFPKFFSRWFFREKIVNVAEVNWQGCCLDQWTAEAW